MTSTASASWGDQAAGEEDRPRAPRKVDFGVLEGLNALPPRMILISPASCFHYVLFRVIGSNLEPARGWKHQIVLKRNQTTYDDNYRETAGRT